MSADQLFGVLGDPTRRTIVQLLVRQGTGTATGLSSELAMSRQAVAKHLHQLTSTGLTISQRVGRETHYVVDPRPLAAITEWIGDVELLWNARLERLKNSLDPD